MLDFSIKTLSDGAKELYVDEKLIASGTQEKNYPDYEIDDTTRLTM